MQKIRSNDEVIVLTGKYKGQRGLVQKVLKNDKVIVGGVNIKKRHTKGNSYAGTAGGIIEKESPIHISNVALFNKETGKGDRVGFKILEDGKKIRIFKSTKTEVDI